MPTIIARANARLIRLELKKAVGGSGVNFVDVIIVDIVDMRTSLKTQFADRKAAYEKLGFEIKTVKKSYTDFPLAGEAVVAATAPDDAADTILDTRTKLTWQHSTMRSDSKAAAADYCTKLGDGWRLPSAKELMSLTDPSRYLPAVDPVFAGSTEDGFFWSATKTSLNGGGELLVGIADGVTFDTSTHKLLAEMVKENDWPIELTSHVRCVRHVPN